MSKTESYRQLSRELVDAVAAEACAAHSHLLRALRDLSLQAQQPLPDPTF